MNRICNIKFNMNVLNIYLSICNIKYILTHIYIIDYYYAAFAIHRSREDLYILTWKDINYVMSNEQKMSKRYKCKPILCVHVICSYSKNGKCSHSACYVNNKL